MGSQGLQESAWDRVARHWLKWRAQHRPYPSSHQGPPALSLCSWAAWFRVSLGPIRILLLALPSSSCVAKCPHPLSLSFLIGRNRNENQPPIHRPISSEGVLMNFAELGLGDHLLSLPMCSVWNHLALPVCSCSSIRAPPQCRLVTGSLPGPGP